MTPRRKQLRNLSPVEMAGLIVVFVGRHGGRLAWRYRAGLTPFWWCLGLLVAGWVAATWLPAYHLVPVCAALVAASVVWFLGEKLSPRAQRIWLALVPSALDDGRPGVLDRPTERGYLSLLLLGAGAWLSARMQFGWVDGVQQALLGLFVVLGVPWWWHRGWRRRKPLNLYVRRWSKVEQNEDLRVWHGSKVVAANSAANSTLLTVKLRGGRTVKHVGGDALVLCSQLGLRPGAITVAQDPDSARRVLVRVVPRDPWVSPIPHPMPAPRSLSLADHPKVLVGKYEDNTDDLFKIGQHVMVCGQTGSGKSEWLQSLLAWLLAFKDAAVVAADLASGATFDVWDGVFAAPLVIDALSAWGLLGRVMALIEHRERKLAARRRAGEHINVLPPSEDEPWVWVIIDEFPDLIKEAKLLKGANQQDLNVITLLERIANKARKVGIWLILGLQNPTNDDAGSSILKGALTGIVGLGLNEHQSRNLWQSLRTEGWDSTPLTVGTYLLRDRDKEHQTPRVAKGLWLPPMDRSRVIAAARERPLVFTGHEARIITGEDAAPPVGTTARFGAFEDVSHRPQLSVVRDVKRDVKRDVNRDAGRDVTRDVTVKAVTAERDVTVLPGRTRREAADEFRERVLRELPSVSQGSVGASAIATQLGVDRSRVTRALKQLRKDGRATPNGDGEWSSL